MMQLIERQFTSTSRLTDLIAVILIIWSLITSLGKPIQAQTTEMISSEFDLEHYVMNYSPEQRADVSDKDFDFASMIIRETKSAVSADERGFNVADYWNICTAFIYLEENREVLELAFQKMLAAEGSCEYIVSLKDKTRLDDIFPAEYHQKELTCSSSTNNKSKFDSKIYAQENSLDIHLVELINEIDLRDQKYRRESDELFRTKQPELDKLNQELINDLFKKHNSYIGKSLVGRKFQHVMWSVIQHSNLSMMEKYLPIVYRAVQDGELPIQPLKMLVDRIHANKYGVQLFGSQSGVSLVEDEDRKMWIEKYKIDQLQ